MATLRPTSHTTMSKIFSVFYPVFALLLIVAALIVDCRHTREEMARDQAVAEQVIAECGMIERQTGERDDFVVFSCPATEEKPARTERFTARLYQRALDARSQR